MILIEEFILQVFPSSADGYFDCLVFSLINWFPQVSFSFMLKKYQSWQPLLRPKNLSAPRVSRLQLHESALCAVYGSPIIIHHKIIVWFTWLVDITGISSSYQDRCLAACWCWCTCVNQIGNMQTMNSSVEYRQWVDYYNFEHSLESQDEWTQRVHATLGNWSV